MLFIIDYWYLWVIGMIVLPIVAVLPQIKNIIEMIDRKDKNPGEIIKLFLNPVSLIISIIGGIGAFVCSAFFFLSIIFAIIKYIKA